MEVIVFIICLIGFTIPFAVVWSTNKILRNKNNELYNELCEIREEKNHYQRLYYMEVTRIKSYPSHSVSKEIPKGTVQAVKEAMKRSHPDNGGNAEDFQMYRRAYNVLTGKEKL